MQSVNRLHLRLLNTKVDLLGKTLPIYWGNLKLLSPDPSVVLYEENQANSINTSKFKTGEYEFALSAFNKSLTNYAKSANNLNNDHPQVRIIDEVIEID